MPAEAVDADLELAEQIKDFYADPLGFVRFAYPWREPGGPLEKYDGPDVWQAEFLSDLGKQIRERKFDGEHPVKPVQEAIASGHGIGKSTLVAWLQNWIMSTRPHAKGTVTANTVKQLSTKTWPAIQKWTGLCITSHWFTINSDTMRAKASPETWFCSAQTCKEENSEAFAGQHAADSTSFYLFDEASAIPNKIWEVAEGGLTDGEPMWFAFGNPTRSDGRFHAATFGRDRDYWKQRSIDSRTCRFTNKELIAQWLEKHGDDSDWFRVRVRGLPPRAGEQQFISNDTVFAAQKRQVQVLVDDPLIMAIDYARGGADDNVIRFRQGLDARSIPAIRIPGEVARDSMVMVARVADVIAQRKPDAVFGDATGGSIGGPINDRLRQLGFKVIDVQFGGESPDRHYANMRAYMWAKMRDWLPRGAIDAGPDLEMDLTGPGYGNDKHDRLILESKEDMKKRGLDSPDDGDALCLTFAQAVAPKKLKTTAPARASRLSPWS